MDEKEGFLDILGSEFSGKETMKEEELKDNGTMEK